MKKKISLTIVTLLLINLFSVGLAFANDFMPPGLAKKDKLPPGLAKQNKIPPGWQKECDNRDNTDKEEDKIEKEITGSIVYKENINQYDWIVIKNAQGLKALRLISETDYNVGDYVEVTYKANDVISIKLLGRDVITKDLVYSLAVSPLVVEKGNEVKFSLKITNNTDKDITKTFSSGQRFDYIVKKDGKKVWQWSEDKNFIAVIQNINFKAHESIYYSEAWKPAEIGNYTVEAYFFGDSKKNPVASKKFKVVESDQDKDLNRLSYKLEVFEGEPTVFMFKVTNPEDEKIQITLPNTQVYDFFVTKDSKKVWQWSDDKVFPTVQKTIDFEPGKTKIYQAEFKPDKKAEYKVYAILKGGTVKDITIGPKTFEG